MIIIFIYCVSIEISWATSANYVWHVMSNCLSFLSEWLFGCLSLWLSNSQSHKYLTKKKKEKKNCFECGLGYKFAWFFFLKNAFKFQRLKIFGNHKCSSRHSFEGKHWVQRSYALVPLRCEYETSVWHVSPKPVHSFVNCSKYLNKVNTNPLVQILYFTFCVALYFPQIIVCYVFDFYFNFFV